MDGCGKSDRPIVPRKPTNKTVDASMAAERVEGRGLAKGNLRQQNAPRTQCREGAPSALERVREAALEATLRYYLRQEPGALGAPAGICAGVAPRRAIPTATFKLN
jgi:hypothetical protein